MSTILKFRMRFPSKRTTTRVRSTRSAEIVIFPGVRYQRWSDPQRSAKSGKVKRDTLKIAD